MCIQYVHVCVFKQPISRGHLIVWLRCELVCLPPHRSWENPQVVLSEGGMIVDCITQKSQTAFFGSKFQKEHQKSTESFFFLGGCLMGHSLQGGPSGRSFGSCPVAMALITHRKNNACGEKWDLAFNCCVCCHCFLGFSYSLAAVGQLLKHLIYSDVFVSCFE